MEWLIVFVLAAAVAWGFLKGFSGKKTKPGATRIKNIEVKTPVQTEHGGVERMLGMRRRRPQDWTQEQIAALPLKVLSRAQWECLGDGADGTAIVITPPFNRYDVRPDGAKGHPSKTVTTLVKHGMLQASEGAYYAVTPVGLCALDCLAVR